MIRLEPWTFKGHTIRPLTVRHRIRLTEELAEEFAKRAAQDCALIGMPFSDRVRFVAEARERAYTASSLISECFTLSGAMKVLTHACETAEALAAEVEPKDLTSEALAAIGIDLDRVQAAAEASGN
jgi:hypothetical protein